MKITTGRLAVGFSGLTLKNWLFRAVNSRGAVSPLMRAKASRAAVRRPLRAERQRTSRITRARGAPSDTPASRSAGGCSDSTSSVVRVINGAASIARATAPAIAEKLWNGATSSS